MNRYITTPDSLMIFRVYLDAAEEIFVKSMLRMFRTVAKSLPDTWEDMKWENKIEDGFKLWIDNELSVFLEDAMVRAHTYIAARIFNEKGLADAWRFEGGRDALEAWIKSHSFASLGRLTKTQMKVLRRELFFWAGFWNKPEQQVARHLAQHIGLLPNQQRQLENMRNAMRADGASASVIKRAADRMRTKMKRERALLMARTEIATAYHEGQIRTMQQAEREGLVGESWKKWVTAGDEQVCATCGPLGKHEAVKLNDTFDGGYMAPPAHPRCRCDLAYFEKE